MALSAALPWTQRPLIINAPMGGFAGADLAAAVTQAGGLGFIGAGLVLEDLSVHLHKAEEILFRHDGLLPIGVGLLPFAMKMKDVLPILERYQPTIVWLFGTKQLEDYRRWTEGVRSVLPKSQVWIQVGSVAAAVTVVRQCKPDVLCVQGIDAGGHGFSRGASLITLLPEVADAVSTSSIPLVAAGGITDGRAAAAAFALGAQGVVMGTRFLSSPETQMHPAYRQAILSTRDGGQSTVRAKLFDELRGPNPWPEVYDGRGIVTESFTDFAGGAKIEEIRRKYAEAMQSEDGGFGSGGKGRAAMWAGTGVGLVKKEQPAAEIVEEVRREAVEVLDRLRSRL